MSPTNILKNARLLTLVALFSTSEFSIAAVDLATNAASQVNGAEPFKVTVTLLKTQVRVKEVFPVAVKVENVTSTNQNLCVMSCSWPQHWSSANRVVQMEGPGWFCLENTPITVGLAPGKSYDKELRMWVPDPVSTNEIAFRMGFNPLLCVSLNGTNPSDIGAWVKASTTMSTNIYWSSEVKIQVVP